MGHDVTILDNITTGQLSNTPIKAKLINIDLADKESLNIIPVEDYKAILHLAAQTSGEISNENPSIITLSGFFDNSLIASIIACSDATLILQSSI